MKALGRVLTSILVGALTAVVGMTDAHAENPKITVLTDWTPHGMHAGLHLAAVKGWFSEAGISVEVIDGKGSTFAIQQIAAGQADVGWVNLGAMATARAQGVPVKSIAGFVRTGDLGALVPRGAGYETLKDLEGKKVAYTASSGWGPLLDAFLKASDTSRDDINLVSVDASALVSAFTSGAVEASLSTVAFFKPIVEKTRPADGILLADVGINIPSYGLVATSDTIESKREALARFVPVVVRAWEYIYDGHEDEAADAIMKQRPNEKLDREILKGQILAFKPFFWTENTRDKRFGWQSEADWVNTIRVLESVGTIPAGTKPSDYYTNEFVSEN